MDFLCLFVPAGYGVWLLSCLKKEKLTWQKVMAWYCNLAIILNLLTMASMLLVGSANTGVFDIVRTVKYLLLSVSFATVICTIYSFFSKRLKVKVAIENEEDR